MVFYGRLLNALPLLPIYRAHLTEPDSDIAKGHFEEASQETLLAKKNGQLVTATRSLDAQTNRFGVWGQRPPPVLLFKYLKNSLSGWISRISPLLENVR